MDRDAFRNAVFARDKHACVVCGAANTKLDAHHIIERRLWPDGGYYLANGATVCEPCHLRAEQTLISCEELRERCGITKTLLPEHLEADTRWDKWGNPVLPSGARLRGELFDDESVQKVLAPVLHLFELARVKYPRTFHVPWSPGVTGDDRVQEDLSAFRGQDVVVTEKMDGENTTLYRDGLHARSLTSDAHPSRDRVKALHASIAHDIPNGWRVCGENLYARHSIAYTGLPGYFLVFSIWNEKNECLSWKDTVEWCALLDLPTVPVIYQGSWDEDRIARIAAEYCDRGPVTEGYTIRVASSFSYRLFRRSVVKYVRENHVQTNEHWKRGAIVPNGLKSTSCITQEKS